MRALLAVLFLPLYGLSPDDDRGGSGSKSTGGGWKTAVVCRCDAGRRTFVGVVHAPPAGTHVPGAVAGAAAPAFPDRRHELWLLGEGSTSGIWFVPQSGSRGSLPEGKPANGADPDTETLRQIERAAAPVHFQSAAHRNPVVVSAQYPGEAAGVLGLCHSCDAIAVGTVADVWRMSYEPTNAIGSPHQRTTVLFAVEQYVKCRDTSRPAVLKISQEGGDLPWTYRDVTGVGQVIKGCPRLQLGERYILFAKSVANIAVRRNSPYFVGTIGGVTERSATGMSTSFALPCEQKSTSRGA